MPYGFGKVGTFTTSQDIGGGRNYTRFKGPLLVGEQYSSQLPGGGVPTVGPHLVNVSTIPADMLISVISTFGSTTGANATTSAPAGLVYITQTTGSGNLIAAGSTANAPPGLPGGQNGVALCWDSAGGTLALYDPLSSCWKWPHSTSSGAGCVVTWSSSSS